VPDGNGFVARDSFQRFHHIGFAIDAGEYDDGGFHIFILTVMSVVEGGASKGRLNPGSRPMLRGSPKASTSA
jgi:hypothetical protein